MRLKTLFLSLAEVLDGNLEIERFGASELRLASEFAYYDGEVSLLKKPILDVMQQSDSHSACKVIADTPLMWEPPKTSNDPAYIAASTKKAHVELLGPDGIIKSSKIRMGLYGMYPDAEYGIRTHPAEEVFVMMAGEAYWKRGNANYKIHGSGERSYHPSMMPHATRTRHNSFMSIYIWAGDVSTENYVYKG